MIFAFRHRFNFTICKQEVEQQKGKLNGRLKDWGQKTHRQLQGNKNAIVLRRAANPAQDKGKVDFRAKPDFTPYAYVRGCTKNWDMVYVNEASALLMDILVSPSP